MLTLRINQLRPFLDLSLRDLGLQLVVLLANRLDQASTKPS